MSNGLRMFDHGPQLINNEWLENQCDQIDGDWCCFEIERDYDGYTKLCVGRTNDPREAYAFEIETGIRVQGGWNTDRVGIGLYKYLGDLRAMLEILARGSHF